MARAIPGINNQDMTTRHQNKLCATLAALLLFAGLTPAHQQNDPGIPPEGDRATQALVDSPRHGEWVEVPIPNSETKIKSWVAYPERADEAPVVIVIHEIFGLTDWIRSVADALAAEGFIAVAPDLLSGMGPNGGGTESFTGDTVREAIRKISDDELTTRLDAVRAHALAFPSASDKTGCIGFCWGGSSSFTYATRQADLKAAVVYYGTGPDATELNRINCPVLGLYGGDDNRVTSTVDPTAKAMTQAEKAFAHHVYEGAGHGFLRQQSGRDGANERAAKAAWRETIAFLQEHLEAEPSK